MSRSDDDDDYFGDPVKLIHTHEDKTFITDGRFLDAEIIDLGEILSSEEEPEYDAPQKTQVLLLGSKKSKDSKTNSVVEIVNEINSKSKNKKNKNNLMHKTHKLEIQKAIEQKNIVKTDIRKNTGLIGMKIERQTDQSLKETFENICNTTSKPQIICKKSKNIKKNKIKCSDKTEIPKENDQSSKSTHKIGKLSKSARNTHEEKTKKKETLNSKPVESKKDNKNKISDKTPTENNSKENEKTRNTGLCNFIETPTDQSNKKNTKVVTQRSFPKLNKFTKCVLKKVLKGVKIRPITTPVKSIKEDKHIKSDIKENKNLPSKEDIPQNCKNIQSVNKKRSIPDTGDNIDLKSIKTGSCPKFQHSLKQNINLRLESFVSSLVQNIEMNAKKTSIARLPNPFPSNSCNTFSIAPKTNSQVQHNPEENESTQLLDHNKNSNNQEQPFPVGLYSVPHGDTINPRHSIGFQYNKPPPEIQKNEKVDMIKLPANVYGNEQTFSYERQRFPDRLIKNTPIQAQNMYRLPPPNAYPPYRYHYPETMSSVPDTSGRYNFNNQNYRCRYGPYKLPYGTDIFAHPPITPPTSTFPPDSQQRLQQTFVHICPQLAQNSTIGSNNDGIIRKNNNPAQLSIKPEVFITEVNRKNGIVKLGNIAEKTEHNPKNVNKIVVIKPAVTKSGKYQELNGTKNESITVAITPVATKSEMLKELNSPRNVNKTVTIPPAVTKSDKLKELNSPKNVNTSVAITPAITKSEMLKGLNSPRNVNKTVTIPPAVTNSDKLKELNSPKNANKTTAFIPAVTKTEMLNELNNDVQPDNYTIYSHGPKNNLKRPLTSLFPIRKENHYHKPCPLSKKAKFGPMLPNQGQITQKHVNKGYSPPILPIPTFENILSETRASEMGSIPYTTERNTANKHVGFRPRHYQDYNTAARKISFDEYKKKKYPVID